jgi:ABC-type branched-subunit amino acid transport system substrate-binding protein
MFIKSINVGNWSIDATSNMTRETGDAVIGAVLLLSGGNSENGLGALKIINLALKQANDYYILAEGLGINFKLEVRDSGSDPATALTQVKALHEMGIDLLIQEKQHVMLIYRNDRYGQDFAKAFAELYKGSIDSFIYETSETSFSPVLERTSSLLSRRLCSRSLPGSASGRPLGLEKN